MIKDSKHLLGVYSIVSDENGYAIQHADGRGFDLTLRALPLDSKLVLREPFDEPSKEQSQDSGAAIKRCLLETGCNIGAALERLKSPRRTLNEKMARLGIDRRRLTPPLRQSSADKTENTKQSLGSAEVRCGAFFQHARWRKNGAKNGH